MRTEEAIFEELGALCTQEGYIHALTIICYQNNFVSFDDALTTDVLAKIYDKENLIRSEITTLIGLMMRAPIDFSIPSVSDTHQFLARTVSILNELHQAIIASAKDSISHDGASLTDDVFASPEALREMIFYSAESAYTHQYRDIAPQKYSDDSEWLLLNGGIKLDVGYDVCRSILKIVDRKMRETIEHSMDIPLEQWTLLPGFVLSCQELARETKHPIEDVRAFVDAFTLAHDHRNPSFRTLQDFNEAYAYPFIRKSSDEVILLQYYGLVEAVYDSPFYWMCSDQDYTETAFRNRGMFTESFSFERLSLVFNRGQVYRNIIIRKFGDIAGEIDVFVAFGDRAIVLQAKSKRLRLEARKGNIQLLQEDFQKAVQDAVDQAYDCAALLADPSITLCTTDDREIQLTAHPLKKIYPITVVSDHYPSLAYQAKHFLNRRRVLNVAPPLITDVFALDSITEMLNSPLRVLSYLELHERHGDKLFVNHEQTLLSLHLKQNLWVGDDTDLVFVNDDVALTLDVAMSVRRDGVDGQAVPDGILTQFRGTHFEKIVSHMEFKDESAAVAMGFFLLEMNEDAIVELNRNIDQLLDRTAADGDFHNFSIGFSDPAAGLTVYCGPVVDPAADLMLGQHCKFRKYCGKADRWLGLRLSPDGSILDMLALESDWKYDLRLERAAKRWLTPKRGKRGRSHKLGRNDLCPCGSGKKYKRCCLHNS